MIQMAKQKKYLFKLTPNKKDVVINTSVLLNGYEDVEYPIPIMDTEKLGYVYDPTTFQFKDKEHVKVDYPYPVRMEMDVYFENLPFYGCNNKCSTDKIRYNEIKPELSYGNSAEPNVYNNYFPENNKSYDEGIFINAKSGDDNDFTLAFYKITVRIYWSDNKSHLGKDYITNGTSAIQNNGWRVKDKNTNAYPFVLRLVPEPYSISSGLKFVDNNSKELLLPNLETNINESDESDENKIHRNVFNVPDNFTMEERNIVKFKIDATFTDPKSLMSVSAYKEVTVKQDAYIGYKTKYTYVKFIDYKPIDIWSPTVYASYNKDRNITYKIDKDTKQDYYAFYVNGSLNIKNYIENKSKYFPDGIYFNGALDVSKKKNQFTIDTFVLDNYCINALEDSSVINGKILNSSDKDAFEKRYNLCYSIAKQLGDFYDSSVKPSSNILKPKNSKGSIFDSISKPNLQVFNGYYSTPYSFSQINSTDTSAYGTKFDITLTENKVRYDSSYRAVCHQSYINNQNYYRINASFIQNNKEKKNSCIIYITWTIYIYSQFT